MRNCALSIALAILFVLICAGARADVTPIISSGAAASGGFNPAPRDLQATVQSVDAAQHEVFLLTQEGPEIQMKVPQNIPITSPYGKAMKLEDLRPGSKIRVRYQPRTVQAINIQQVP